MATDKAGRKLSHGRQTAAPRATAQQRALIIKLLARGYAPAEAVAVANLEEGASQDILEGILRDPAALGELTAAAWSRVQAALPRAVSVVMGQIDSDNEWIAQNAARSIIDLAQRAAQQVDSAPVVTFGSMPAPGIPATRDEDD